MKIIGYKGQQSLLPICDEKVIKRTHIILNDTTHILYWEYELG